MLDLDGSEGGGQLLRTALSLSAVETTPFRMTGVRGSRPEPGLMPQHLTAVETVAAVTDAEVTGAELGSEELTFEPGLPTGGDYEADVGTAGSVTLLFDALLPVSVAVEAPLAVRARGGTDVQWSPPLDYARLVKLPLLRRRGSTTAWTP
jgi:RNA 3'-terminal phosphate cyclase (ATP)